MSSQRKAASLPDHGMVALALLLLLNSCVTNWTTAIRSPKMDFFTLWCLPQCSSLDSISNIYSVEGQKQLAACVRESMQTAGVSTLQRQVSGFVLEFYGERIDTIGTPFLYAALGVLSSGNYLADRTIFITASLICFLLSIVILSRLLRSSYLFSIVACVFFVSAFEPFLSDLRVGNLNQIQLLLISLLIWGMSKSVKDSQFLATGFLLGLAALLKPNIGGIVLLNALIYAFDRRRKRLILLIGSFSGALLAFLLASLYFKSIGIWFDFAESLPASLKFSYPLEHGNFSLTSLLFYITKRDYSVSIMFLLLLFLLYLLYQSKLNRDQGKVRVPSPDINEIERNASQTFAEIGISFTVTLLAAGLSWLHYYTLLVPTMLFSVRFGYSVGKRRQLLSHSVSLASMLFFSHLTQIVIRGGPMVTSVLINLATALLFAISLLQFWWLHITESTSPRHFADELEHPEGNAP
jgi:hypothetical protein